MRLLLAAGLVAVASAAGTDDNPELLFPAGSNPARLRLEVTADGPRPDAAWAAFLDRLFDHFDRNGDGVLSSAEAGRVFPLPLPGGREARMDFTALDTDKDGKGTRTEFRAFYRAAGFTPVAVVVEPAPAAVLALAGALFRHLDRDGDGACSATEIRQAPALLRRLDEDEDEVLTAEEILAPVRPGRDPAPAGLMVAPVGSAAPEATLRFPVGGRESLADGAGPFHLSAGGTTLRVPGGTCTLTAVAADPAAGPRAARGFYLAQFKAAAGDKPAAKRVFDDDPAAQGLASLFDAADRDGNGRLARAELAAFFDLVESGVGCRVVVAATDRGRNLFDLFDADGDGRLDAAELTRAAREFPGSLPRTGPLTPETVPASYRLAVGRGPVGDTFGPLSFGAAASPRPREQARPPGGPDWFRAVDRNGDGFVSPHEFIGPPRRFAQLDADGDGRISLDEAARAGPSSR